MWAIPGLFLFISKHSRAAASLLIYSPINRRSVGRVKCVGLTPSSQTRKPIGRRGREFSHLRRAPTNQRRERECQRNQKHLFRA